MLRIHPSLVTWSCANHQCLSYFDSLESVVRVVFLLSIPTASIASQPRHLPLTPLLAKRRSVSNWILNPNNPQPPNRTTCRPIKCRVRRRSWRVCIKVEYKLNLYIYPASTMQSVNCLSSPDQVGRHGECDAWRRLGVGMADNIVDRGNATGGYWYRYA